jgi:AcrR family transcriptional regulator
MRAIAARAGCDPALVHYFFSNKAKLFAAAVKLPASPATVVEHALSGGVDGIGERLATALIERLDSPDSHDPLLAIVRSAAGHEDAARMLREYLTMEALVPLATGLDANHPHLRASLAGSQIIGFVMARYVVRLEPLASADRTVAARCLGDSLQRSLTTAAVWA